MLLVLLVSAVDVKESCHLMRDLELHLFLDCFSETYTAATAMANTLKRASDRKGGGGRKKGLQVGFSADEIENGNGLIGLEEEEDTSSDSFDEM